LNNQQSQNTRNKNGFNPLVSPNINNQNNMGNMDIEQILMMQKMYEMNNGNHLNSNGGVQISNDTNAKKNLDAEQLDAYIKKMKDKIYHHMNMTNFNPSFLHTLDSKQLEVLINKLSYDLSGLSDIMPFNQQSNPQNNQQSNPPNNPPNNQQSNPPNNQQKQISDYNVELFDSMTIENVPFKLNNITLTDDDMGQQSNRIKHSDILIKSSDYGDPEDYSDYMVEFKDGFNNITNFQIIDLNIPKISNEITNDNQISITLDNDIDIQTAIEIGLYNTETLINAIRKALPNFTLNIDHNDKIVIKSISNQNFEIINNDNSVFKQLGFIKPHYSGKKTYISEEKSQIDIQHTVNLFIEGIEDTKPILVYNSNMDPKKMLPINISFCEPIKNLQEIFVKFKLDSDPDSSNFINFRGRPHELRCRVTTL